jgi:hypothetical protein
MQGLLRVLLPLAVVASALIATSAAPAANADWGHRAGPAAVPAGKLAPSIRRAVRTLPAARSGKAVVRGAETAQLAAGEFPGFAYCGADVAYAWPADAPNHDMTITQTFAVTSANGTFSDAVVSASPYYVIQVGQNYYFWDIALGEVAYGPTSYADAWLDFDLTGNTDYVLFVNAVSTIDGGTASTESVLLDAFGTSEVGTTNVCRP